MLKGCVRKAKRGVRIITVRHYAGLVLQLVLLLVTVLSVLQNELLP